MGEAAGGRGRLLQLRAEIARERADIRWTQRTLRSLLAIRFTRPLTDRQMEHAAKLAEEVRLLHRYVGALRAELRHLQDGR
ncbi:MAG: hypothetical protein HY332_16700 [Chloroflexi bacterium]|nr:hypothetical protein [Chloroflexota bacterium]